MFANRRRGIRGLSAELLARSISVFGPYNLGGLVARLVRFMEDLMMWNIGGCKHWSFGI